MRRQLLECLHMIFRVFETTIVPLALESIKVRRSTQYYVNFSFPVFDKATMSRTLIFAFALLFLVAVVVEEANAQYYYSGGYYPYYGGYGYGYG